MTDFLPDYHYFATPDGYMPAYRLYDGKPFRAVPQASALSSKAEAVDAAKAYVRLRLNPPIRRDTVRVEADALGVTAWRKERADRVEGDQQDAFGAIVVKGREITVERKRTRQCSS